MYNSGMTRSKIRCPYFVLLFYRLVTQQDELYRCQSNNNTIILILILKYIANYTDCIDFHFTKLSNITCTSILFIAVLQLLLAE